MLVGDNIFSVVASPLPCALDLYGASHVGQSAGLTAFGASGAVETPLGMRSVTEVRLVGFILTCNRTSGRVTLTPKAEAKSRSHEVLCKRKRRLFSREITVLN